MMRMKVALLVVLSFVFVMPLRAQTIVDHWSTATECMMAQGAPFYYPTIVTKRKLAKNEVVWGHPTGGCVPMVLPDRFGGRGFVRIEIGRQFVHDRVTGEELRLAECNNDLLGTIVPFPIPEGVAGPKGANGATGSQGSPGLRGLRGVSGLRGEPGPPGRDGLNGQDGRDGHDGRDVVVIKKSGFPWKKTIIVGLIGGAVSVTAYRYWPCPPGSVRR